MESSNTDKPCYLNEKQVAELIGVSVSKLQNDRFYGRGLNYIKIGRTVRYSLEKIHRYMQEHTVNIEKQ